MNIDFHFRDKIPVAVLGATGMVGQKFVQHLIHHPWFKIETLAASEKSAGRRYGDVVNWEMEEPLPNEIKEIIISPCTPDKRASIAFSALTADAAKEIEPLYAEAGVAVVSNASAFRMDERVPLVVPEVNLEHLERVKVQQFANRGLIVTIPNCVVAGLVVALKPLVDAFGVDSLMVSTLQALSGAGDQRHSIDIQDNVIPYIRSEEEKVESEPMKIFGRYEENLLHPYPMRITAHCSRVAVSDGHLENVSLKFKSEATKEEILKLWREFPSLALPSAPKQVITYFDSVDAPQPKHHRDLERGMGVAIGRLRRCPLLDWKFSLLSHNRVRGAVGTGLLIGEALVKQGAVFW